MKNVNPAMRREPNGATVAEILRADGDQAPDCLLDNSPYLQPLRPISKDRYHSRDWHDREVRDVWRKVWQMACREEEIPEQGDYVVYDVADISIIVTRGKDGAINAFYNSCLHRATQLAPSGATGSVDRFRCPYHGWTYDIDGALTDVPCRWDFPQLDGRKPRLDQVRVGTWGGFVFINMDANGPSLEDYLGVLPAHFTAWPLERRRTAAHVAKVIACNWKVGIEAFLEGYHVAEVHPQALPFTGDTNGQLDVWGDHISRMIAAVATPSPRIEHPVTDAMIIDHLRAFLAGDVGEQAADGQSPRHVMAGAIRKMLTDATGVDHGNFSTSEIIDAVNYLVFPNLMPWAGYGTPIVYRLRPYGSDPDRSILEVYLLYAVPDDAPVADPVETRWLKEGESWTGAPELGGLGAIFDQDEQNFELIQRGLKAGGPSDIALSEYQESRIRHLHDTLERYLGVAS